MHIGTMGRFFAIVLVLAACGDNLAGPTATAPRGGAAGAVNSLAPVTTLVPQVCGDLQWTGVVADPAVQVSAVAASSQVELISAPLAGGSLTGYRFDTSDKSALLMDQVPLSDTFTAVGVSRVQDRVVAAAVGASAVHVDLLDDAMQNPTELAKLSGTHVAQPAMLTADSLPFVPVGSDTGVTITSFDDAWHVSSSYQLAATGPVTSLTASPYGSAALLGWSTDSACYIGLVYAPRQFSPGAITHTGYACPGARLAADGRTGSASLVFEANGGIRLTSISTMKMTGPQLLRPNASAPRVMFDGARTWVSYLDERGDVVVGFLNGNELVSTAIEDLHPQGQSYELVNFDGAPWVFALSADGYTAHRLCLAAE